MGVQAQHCWFALCGRLDLESRADERKEATIPYPELKEGGEGRARMEEHGGRLGARLGA